MKIKIVKAGKNLVKELKTDTWPLWSSPVAEFDWHYDDNETCLFLEGFVTVTSGTSATDIKAGEIAVFPKGLSCRWKVHKAVRKRYSFGPVPALLQ